MRELCRRSVGISSFDYWQSPAGRSNSRVCCPWRRFTDKRSYRPASRRVGKPPGALLEEKGFVIFRFISAMVRNRWAKLRGYEIFTPADELSTRNAICEACVYNVDGVCDVCHCLILAKTSLATESCPKKFWKSVWVRRKPPYRKADLKKPKSSAWSP